MDNDAQTTKGCNWEPEEERQNRRQFFNGLGKWSLAIIAAVTALREDLQDVRSGIGSQFEASSEGAGDTRQQLAKKPLPQPHPKPWTDEAYARWSRHTNNTGLQGPGGTGPAGPGGSQDKMQ